VKVFDFAHQMASIYFAIWFILDLNWWDVRVALYVIGVLF
jgi:hypothetical protein